MFTLANYYFNPHALPVFFVGALTFFIGLFVVLQNRKSPVNISYSLMSLSTSIWLVATAIGYCSLDELVATYWFRIDNFGVLFISINIYYLSRSVLGLKPGLFTYIGYVQALIFGVIELNTDWLVTGASRFYWGYFPKWGLFSILVFLIFFGYMAASLYFLTRALAKRELSPEKRNQIKYLILAYLMGYIAAIDFLPTLGISIYPFGYFPYLASILLIAYSVVKYHLLDITIAITRTALLLVVYGAIFVIPIMVAYTYKELIYEFIGTKWGLSLSLVGAYSITASLAPLFYSYLQRRAENLLLKEQRRYQNALIQLSTTLTLTKDQDRLLKLIVLKVAKQVKVHFACMYLDSPSQDRITQKFPYTTEGFFPNFPVMVRHDSRLASYIKKNKRPILAEELSQDIKKEFNLKAGMIIPSFIRQRLLGFLVLGPKSSGAMYTEEDTSVFRILSAQVGLGIENTQFIKELDEMHAKVVEAEKLKGIAQMMYSEDHEFRNLFNKINMAVQLIQSGAVGDKALLDKNLNVIFDNINTCTEILGSIRSYINKSKSDKIRPTKIDDIVNIGVNHFAEKFTEANIKLTVQIQPDLPPIQAYETLDDMPLNILYNCYYNLREIKDKEKLIDIKAKMSNDKAAIELIISDTGADITKDADTHDTGSPFKERGKLGGVNLGLAYLIANQHNATIKIASYEKGGTTFIINISIVRKGAL